jgi:hypothetical protein
MNSCKDNARNLSGACLQASGQASASRLISMQAQRWRCSRAKAGLASADRGAAIRLSLLINPLRAGLPVMYQKVSHAA